ncbi:MAG: hypothetical protein ABI325_08475 [Ginsengibacter sp.]
MVALPLDKEFMEYWLKLSLPEKETLLSVAKIFVELKKDLGRISIEQYNKELDEAMTRMDNDEFYTQEQAVQISKSRLNGK